MFEDSTFESANRIHTRSRRWMIAAFALNGSILLALILIPLIYPEALPGQYVPFLMEVPPAPRAPEPPKLEPAHAAPIRSEMDLGHIFAPSKIPHGIFRPNEPEPPSLGDTAVLSDGPSGPGVPGGVFSGPSVRPVLRPEPKATVRVPSAVEAGLLIQKTIPVYPPIAGAMRVGGTVVLAATISRVGTIENLHVVSGPPMLQQAAVDAVRTWRYRPYLLNGEPIEVETTVNVIFTLNR
jgi:protein TonB